MNKDDEVIVIKNASIRRNNNYLLKNLSLTIKKGENWCIFGPNGSGKSSLIKLLCNDYHPLQTEGLVYEIFGQKRWNIWELKSHLGMIRGDLDSQYYQQTYSTGYDVVLSGLFSSIGVYQKASSEQHDKTEQTIEQLSIQNLSNKKTSTMSSGELRKCLIGRALINDPAYLVLDEPTTGLDIKAQYDFIQLMKKLVKNGTSIILVTHQMDEIIPEIDHVALLSDGQIVSQGEKQSIMTTANISNLFSTSIELQERKGILQAFIS